MVGLFLLGWGAFNLVEGVINHLLLGIHHVNERVPREHWIWWDLGFLAWGAAMLVIGWLLARAGERETLAAMSAAPVDRIPVPTAGRR